MAIKNLDISPSGMPKKGDLPKINHGMVDYEKTNLTPAINPTLGSSGPIPEKLASAISIAKVKASETSSSSDAAIIQSLKMDEIILKRTTLYQFIYSILGWLLGFSCVVGGILLFFYGISGNSDMKGAVGGFNITVTNAAPGTILFIIGIFVVWVTRFKIKVKSGK